MSTERYFISDRAGIEPRLKDSQDFKFTGRIKYTHRTKTEMYLEIEYAWLIRKIPVVTGHLWWKQKHKPEDTFTTVKLWIHESDIYEAATREDYIHECNHT